jgi:hypothetical protein
MKLHNEDLFSRAQDYTWCALERGYRPGAGQHVPDRLHAR